MATKIGPGLVSRKNATAGQNTDSDVFQMSPGTKHIALFCNANKTGTMEVFRLDDLGDPHSQSENVPEEHVAGVEDQHTFDYRMGRGFVRYHNSDGTDAVFSVEMEEA